MTIEVETGPMFSGKTKALEAHIEAHVVAGDEFGKDYLTFNHAIDERYGVGVLGNHEERENSKQRPAVGVRSGGDVLRYIGEEDGEGGVTLKEEYKDLRAVYIDEGQFFEDDLAMVVQYIDEVLGVDVVVAGLDMDFKGEPFGPMPRVMAVADEVRKYRSVCNMRNGDRSKPVRTATRTQRVVNGEPANYDDPVVVVGAEEAYEARCEEHHEVPNKPGPLSR